MEFRLAADSDRQWVESLWAYCFEPREHPFFRWYFSRYYQPENVLLGIAHDDVVCLTHLNPYTLCLRGVHVPTSYIVGLATHPAGRRSGAGRELLTAALKEMKRRRHYVHILMPSKAGFYQPYGYELYCHQWKETMDLESLRPLTEKNVRFAFVNSPDQWPYLAEVYEKYTAGLSGYAVRNEASWRSHIEAQLAEGHIAVVFDHDEPIAYMFYQLGAPTIVSGEFVYSSIKGRRGLLEYMYNHRSQGTAFQWNEGMHDQSYRFYPDGKKGHETMPFMTCRIVDVKGALEQIPYPAGADGRIVLQITDPLAPWNTGIFCLTVRDGAGTVQKIEQGQADAVMPVGTLALLVFGAMDVSDLAFNEKITAEEKALRQLAAFFPKETCYINEWY